MEKEMTMAQPGGYAPTMAPVGYAPQPYEPAMVVNQPPPQMQMGGGLQNLGRAFQKTMADRSNFQIVQEVDLADGCCYHLEHCDCFAPAVKERRYGIIGENFIEVNDPYAKCVCCCVDDSIEKIYYDTAPFSSCWDKIFDGSKAAYVTQEDTNYCCYCINCVCWYNLCTKPCYGGFVAKVPCERDSCCFLINTRCCLGGGAASCLARCCTMGCCRGCKDGCCFRPVFGKWVGDAPKMAAYLQQQNEIFGARAKGK